MDPLGTDARRRERERDALLLEPFGVDARRRELDLRFLEPLGIDARRALDRDLDLDPLGTEARRRERERDMLLLALLRGALGVDDARRREVRERDLLAFGTFAFFLGGPLTEALALRLALRSASKASFSFMYCLCLLDFSYAAISFAYLLLSEAAFFSYLSLSPELRFFHILAALEATSVTLRPCFIKDGRSALTNNR
jgi:hypothetical protein